MTVYQEVQVERRRQNAQWGGASHDDQHFISNWRTYIRDFLEGHRGPDYRSRMIAIAALAIAAVESWDRKQASTDPQKENS